MEKSAPLYLDAWLEKRLSGELGLPVGKGAGGLPLRDALWRRQAATLAATLEHAFTGTLHYREKLSGLNVAGICAQLRKAGSDCAAAAEEAVFAALARLPFTYPAELAAAPESFLAVPHDDVAGIIFTSGTSAKGRGKRIFCAREDLLSSIDFFRHGMRYLVKPGRDRVALCMSGERPGSVGFLFREAMAALGVECKIAGFAPGRPAGAPVPDAADGAADGGATAEYLRALLDFRPTCLVGAPGQLLALARGEAGQALASTVDSALFSGDSAPASLRLGVERAWGCRVSLHYGLTECGLGGAVECGLRQGCHGREADIFTEIDDGEIILTSLTRRGMPLIRYRSGDFGELPREPCGCGSALWRLFPLGRRSECLDLGGGDILKSWEVDGDLYAFPWVCSVILTARHAAEGRLAGLEIKIGANLARPERERAETEAAEKLLPLRARLNRRGVWLRVCIEPQAGLDAPAKRSLTHVYGGM